MKVTMNKSISAIAAIGIAIAAASPAQAQLVADGITYTLTETATSNASIENFELAISGINSATDTEGGRYGVQSFAFTSPSGLISATAPSGFTYLGGGLNANGCSGSGGFFCFSNNTTPSTLLGANSSLLYDFTVTATGISSWAPDFKINWVGTNNNYDLVSQAIPISPGTTVSAPEIDPASAASGLALLLGGLAVMRGRKPKPLGLAV